MHRDDPARPAVLARLRWERPWCEDSADAHELCQEFGMGRMRTRRVLERLHPCDDTRGARYEARRLLRRRAAHGRARRHWTRTAIAALRSRLCRHLVAKIVRRL